MTLKDKLVAIITRLTNISLGTKASTRSYQQGQQLPFAYQRDQNLRAGYCRHLAVRGNLTFDLSPLNSESHSRHEKANARGRSSASPRELKRIRWGKHATIKLPQICPNGQTNES